MSESNGALPSAFQGAMAGVSQWRREAESLLEHRMSEIDREEERIRDAIARLQKELEALDGLRDEVRGEGAALDREQTERAHQAMLDGLGRDRDQLAGRAVALAEAREARHAEAAASLDDPEVAELVAEYERFSELEGTLDALPESYRLAIQAHHEAVTRRLVPLFEKFAAADLSLDAPECQISLVACLEDDEDDGSPESLTFLLPVDAGVYARWADRDEDLPARLGYRVVALATRLAKTLGIPDAPLTWREHEELLSVQLWLGDDEIAANIAEAAEAAVAEELGRRADHLAAAKVKVGLVWVDPDVFDPPEEAPAAVRVRIATVVGGA
jgi:hypothetical protein